MNRRTLLTVLLSKKVSPWYLSGGVPLVNCVGAYLAKGAASQAASYINLANPGTYDITTDDAPAWNALTGWTFSGTKYLTAAITDIGANHSILARYYPTSVNDSMRLFEARAQTYTMIPYTSSRTYYNGGNKAVTVTTNINTNYVSGIAGTAGYTDGNAEAAIPTGSYSAGNLCIGNRLSDKARPLIGRIYCISVYDVVLSLAQVVAITNAMNAL